MEWEFLSSHDMYYCCMMYSCCSASKCFFIHMCLDGDDDGLLLSCCDGLWALHVHSKCKIVNVIYYECKAVYALSSAS